MSMLPQNPKPMYPDQEKFFNDYFMKKLVKTNGRYSWADLAREIQTSGINVSRWARGEQRPSLKWLDPIAVVMGPGAYKACGSAPRIPPDKDIEYLVENWHELTRDERKLILSDISQMIERKKAIKV